MNSTYALTFTDIFTGNLAHVHAVDTRPSLSSPSKAWGRGYNKTGDEGVSPRKDTLQAEDESISAYLKRVDLYFVANDMNAAKQVPSSIEAKTYELLRSLTAPKAQKEKSLKELKDCHFEPVPIVIAETYRFHRREQKARKSIAESVAELRRLTTHCKF